MRSLGGALALVTVLAVLTGCGGDPEPRFEAEPSAEPSASSTPSAAAESKAWEEKTDAGAVAFVKHWLRLFREAENTGNTEALRSASTDDCTSCSRFVDEIDRVYDAGGEIRSDGWTVLSTAEPIERDSTISIPFEVEQSDQQVRETADATLETNRGIRIGLAAELVWKRGEWRMARLDVVR